MAHRISHFVPPPYDTLHIASQSETRDQGAADPIPQPSIVAFPSFNMARVTRSRKFVIAEDDTALVSQTPLPTTPAKQSEALLEANILMATNTFTTMDDVAAAAEVKGLKAAYKSALGVGKKLKRSTKGNKRKDKQNDSDATLVEEQGSGDLAMASSVLQTDSPLLQGMGVLNQQQITRD